MLGYTPRPAELPVRAARHAEAPGSRDHRGGALAEDFTVSLSPSLKANSRLFDTRSPDLRRRDEDPKKTKHQRPAPDPDPAPDLL